MTDPKASRPGDAEQLKNLARSHSRAKLTATQDGRSFVLEVGKSGSFAFGKADARRYLDIVLSEWGTQSAFVDALCHSAEQNHSKAFDALAGWCASARPERLSVRVTNMPGRPLAVRLQYRAAWRAGLSAACDGIFRRLGDIVADRGEAARESEADRRPWTRLGRRMRSYGQRLALWGLRGQTALRRVITSDNGVLRFHVPAVLVRASVVARLGDLPSAVSVIESIEGSVPFPIVEDAAFAVRRGAAGQRVPKVLRRYLGDLRQELGTVYCTNPFRQFDIQADGNVLVCCGHFLPQPIGNVVDDGDVVNSPMARRIRRSVTDGSFDFCFLSRCHLALRDQLPSRDSMKPEIRHSVENGYAIASPRSVVFGLDETCNLSCPSCRSGLIIAKSAEQEKKTAQTEKYVVPILHQSEDILINTAGEFLVSKCSRRLLEKLSPETHPRLTVNLITNGTLFTEQEWAAFRNMHDMVGYVRISVDAATGPTFEKLRRKGHWARFNDNIAFIASLRRQGRIKELQFSFTYQVDNLDEMLPFIEWACERSADRILFERLQNLEYRTNWTDAQYRERAVHLPSHPRYPDFLATIARPEFRDPRVMIDMGG